MKKMNKQKWLLALGSVFIVLVIFLTSCNMPGASENKIPATPTVVIQIPVVTLAATDTTEEVVQNPTEEPMAPTATPEEVAATEDTTVEEADPTMIPTAEVITLVEVVEPTLIPANDSTNPDATVYFSANTNCYLKADSASGLSGVAIAASALGAVDRVGNFYQVHHPRTGGLFCWVTGEGISPNQAAFKLGK